jgi:hypothetical protein
MTKCETTKKLKAPHLPSSICHLRNLGSEVGKRLVNVKVNVNLGGEYRVASDAFLVTSNSHPATVSHLPSANSHLRTILSPNSYLLSANGKCVKSVIREIYR